jgi:hypothetical protein
MAAAGGDERAPIQIDDQQLKKNLQFVVMFLFSLNNVYASPYWCFYGNSAFVYPIRIVSDTRTLGVCSLQMIWFWWMRVGRGLTRSYSCGDELWRQKVFGLVGLKQST